MKFFSFAAITLLTVVHADEQNNLRGGDPIDQNEDSSERHFSHGDDCPFTPPGAGPNGKYERISDWGGWLYDVESIRTYHIYESAHEAIYEYIGAGSSLVDIGAGVGQMKVALDRINADVDYTGFDGGANIMEMEGVHAPVYGDDKHVIPKLCWADASKPFDIHRTFDVVLSKEVGEHIPKEGEAAFMDNLIRLAKPRGGRIILTWAQPGQGGKGHVNCQSKSYVIEEMEKRGVVFDELNTNWLGRKILPGYAKNLMIFFKQ